MPIKREARALYPDDWDAISLRIRFERAGGRCERVIDGMRCEAVQDQPSPITGSMVKLQVAHLNHDPADCRDENLGAFCQDHHLRYDRHHHRACPATPDLFLGVA